jgi:hypothetical protein
VRITQAANPEDIEPLLKTRYTNRGIRHVEDRALEGGLNIQRSAFFLRIELPDGGFIPSEEVASDIIGVIHLPGLRGNPARTYPVTAIGPTYFPHIPHGISSNFRGCLEASQVS